MTGVVQAPAPPLDDFAGFLETEIRQADERVRTAPRRIGFFQSRTINECMTDAKNMKTPEKLYLSLVFENELTILCADTGIGKSIFAVQIAEEIARSGRIVLYLDLELSGKQFEGRYSENYSNHHVFSDNLIRVDFDPDYSIPEGVTYEDYFIESLTQTAKVWGASVVIIDNMTALISTDTDAAKSAKPLMDRLNRIKKDYNLTLLVLEHTRKTDAGRPISLNDMQGSKMKANFADAVFTIGRSAKDKNLRYVKQLKCRSAEVEYDSDNVLLYEIVKDTNFLHFRPRGFSTEYEHLQHPSDDDKTARRERAKELREAGLSNVAIAKELGVSEGSVRYWLKGA